MKRHGRAHRRASKRARKNDGDDDSMSQTTIDRVPAEILYVVLATLDACDLVIARRVCAAWDCIGRCLQQTRPDLARPSHCQFAVEMAKRGNLAVLKRVWADDLDGYSNCWILDAAVIRGRASVVEWIVTEKKCKPMPRTWEHAARRTDNIDIIRGLAKAGRYWTKMTVCALAEHGRMSALQVLLDAGGSFDASAAYFAADSGHADLVRWLHSMGCPLDARVCTAAAFRGDVDLLWWAHARGCPLSCGVHKGLARHGLLSEIRRVESHGVPIPYNDCLGMAIAGGQIDTAEWMLAAGAIPHRHMYERAAAAGHVHMLDWLHGKCPLIDGLWKAAARHGQYDVLVWAENINYPRGFGEDDDSLCEEAAFHGHLDLLKRLVVEWRPTLGEGLTNSAAAGGNLDVLRWLRSVGCPWSTRTCDSAASNGYQEAVRWLIDAGCPVDAQSLARADGTFECSDD
ncbi:Ankyrin repeat domain containing protein [Pandoravirus neocaledonia]|uniref:Ankyrin repeat domain containing protein n=1 Tax=Pandoravirus neocaledonia TaxID=2107708 RepID=A0A2U7UDE1_9VIRU|nr:Ankyrin repeat domain containing protein [Pandoravirus neocaledonia]AVK76375.1 Ankyrin repeat domain containing protein [Pandoravirus neocaledonia]